MAIFSKKYFLQVKTPPDGAAPSQSWRAILQNPLLLPETLLFTGIY
jgi:hypothetical protein